MSNLAGVPVCEAQSQEFEGDDQTVAWKGAIGRAFGSAIRIRAHRVTRERFTAS